MSESGFDVEYVARLAHLSLGAEEAGRFSEQLGDILKYVDKLREVDISGIEPTMHGHGRVNAFRDDSPVASMDKEAFLVNAPGRTGDEYRLPKIVEDA